MGMKLDSGLVEFTEIYCIKTAYAAPVPAARYFTAIAPVLYRHGGGKNFIFRLKLRQVSLHLLAYTT